MNKELQNQIDEAIAKLIEILLSVNEEKLNIVPFEGSWTAGQLAQHMILSNSGFADLINGPVRDTDRAPDEHIDDLRSFLDFSIKFKSPEFVRPPEKDYDKKELLHSLREIKTRLHQILETADLTKTCVAFEIPVTGYLTGLEAAHFVLFHTQRHIHQLKNITNKLVTHEVSPA
jgi:hypothetical protein